MHDPSSNEASLRLVLAALLTLATSPGAARILRPAPSTSQNPTGEAAAWRNIGDACEIIADSVRFLAERVTPAPPRD